MPDKHFILNEHVTYLDSRDKVLIRPASMDTRQRSQAHKEEEKTNCFQVGVNVPHWLIMKLLNACVYINLYPSISPASN